MRARERDRCRRAEDLGDGAGEGEARALEGHEAGGVDRHRAGEELGRGCVAHARVEPKRVEAACARGDEERESGRDRRAEREREVGEEACGHRGCDDAPLLLCAEKADPEDVAGDQSGGKRDQPPADQGGGAAVVGDIRSGERLRRDGEHRRKPAEEEQASQLGVSEDAARAVERVAQERRLGNVRRVVVIGEDEPHDTG